MKKDMGGAATALALAHMIMARGLKVRLRVLIPAVENSISGASFRPRDIYTSRKGITVEIGNTDAEGRLVLADALALADEDKPELIVDFATLTGAARVALGPDLPPFFTDDDALAAELDARTAPPRTIRSGACRCGGPTRRCSNSKVADTQQCRHRRPWRRHHRGAVPAPLRDARKSWAAFRHLRLDAGGQARPAGRRRMPGGARALCAALRALRARHGRARSRACNPFRPDLAAKYLQGQVEAARFVEGTRYEVIEPSRRLRRAPSHEARARHRSAARRARHVYETDRRRLGLGPARNRRLCRLAAGQCARPAPAPAPTHKVAALRTLVFPGADIKTAAA